MVKTVNALSIARLYYHIVLLTPHQYQTCWWCSICSCSFLLLLLCFRSLIEIFNRKLNKADSIHKHTYAETDKIRSEKYLVAFVHSVSIEYHLNFYLETSDDSSIYITTEKTPKRPKSIMVWHFFLIEFQSFFWGDLRFVLTDIFSVFSLLHICSNKLYLFFVMKICYDIPLEERKYLFYFKRIETYCQRATDQPNRINNGVTTNTLF